MVENAGMVKNNGGNMGPLKLLPVYNLNGAACNVNAFAKIKLHIGCLGMTEKMLEVRSQVRVWTTLCESVFSKTLGLEQN